MKRILEGIETISNWSGKAISIFILIIVVIVMWEVILRYVFDNPTFWVHETCRHLFGSYSVLAGAYALLYREHVKVDIIYDRFSPRGRAILDSVTSLLLFLFVGVILVYGWQMGLQSVKIMETTTTPFASPVYPLKLTIPVAAFLILLQGLVHFIRALSMAITGKELA